MRAHASSLRGWGAMDTVLISRKAFTPADAALIREASAAAQMDVVYAPGDAPVNRSESCWRPPTRQEFFRGYPYNVAPVNDDQPFFFYTVQPRDLWEFFLHASTLSADYKVNRAVPLLFGVVGISLAATALILLLPRWLLGTRLPKQDGVVGFLWYFVCLGAGYILIQVAMIQRFILLLGHPEYALTVIVFSMLVWSGLGSYASKTVVAGDDGKLVRVLAFIAVLIAALAAAAGPLVSAAAAWPTEVKIAVTALVDRPGGIPDGDAVSQRIATIGTTARGLGAMGLVAKCGVQRSGLRGCDFSGDLSGIAGDAADRRRALSLRDDGGPGHGAAHGGSLTINPAPKNRIAILKTVVFLPSGSSTACSGSNSHLPTFSGS